MNEHDYVIKKARLKDLNAQILSELQTFLPIRFQNPEWYLTGVQVGLQSLQMFYEAARNVYHGNKDQRKGAASVENLKTVYQLLVQFSEETCPYKRSKIFLKNKTGLEILLSDLTESQPVSNQKAFAGERFSLIQQIALDLLITTNLYRSHKYLGEELKISVSLGFFQRAERKSKIENLLRDFQPTLEEFHINDTKSLQQKKFVNKKIEEIHCQTQREFKRIKTIRDNMYRGHQVRTSENPLDDLHPKKIVPFLKKISSSGVEYLQRAHTAYEHALQKSKIGESIQQEYEIVSKEIANWEKEQQSQNTSDYQRAG